MKQADTTLRHLFALRPAACACACACACRWRAAHPQHSHLHAELGHVRILVVDHVGERGKRGLHSRGKIKESEKRWENNA